MPAEITVAGRGGLPAFDDAADCPACGHYEVGTVYCPGRAVRAFDPRTPLLLRYVLPRAEGPCRYGAGPHLHRVCARCTYTWPEATVNDLGRMLP